MIYKKYLIKETDQFNPDDFPRLTEDLEIIGIAMASVPSAYNKEMLISFLKDHKIQNDWVNANPRLAEMISSKSLPVKNLEELFDSCSHNPTFRKGLEEYISVIAYQPVHS